MVVEKYWVTAGEHDLKFACGRWESDKVVDGSTYSKGQRTVSFEAGETYFLAGKRTGSGRNVDVCSLHKFTYEEAKKKANSILQYLCNTWKISSIIAT